MSNVLDFSSDKINIFSLNIDESGSMKDYTSQMIKGLELYRKSFRGFSEENSIAVSMNTFADNLYLENFKKVRDINIDYSPDGATVLYYTIVKSAEALREYIDDVITQTGVVPISTFIVFSDGEPCNDKADKSDAIEAIKILNTSGVNTVFVAFGKAVERRIGESLGFQATVDIKNEKNLINFFGVELSKSCKEQSKSLKTLGSNFFSQANKKDDKEYSEKAGEVLNNSDFLDDIWNNL